jgi:hypothetical protein
MSKLFDGKKMSDAEKLTLIRIRNLQRDNEVSKKKWAESQNKMLSMVNVDIPVEPKKLITNESNKLVTNTVFITKQAEINLLKIMNQEQVETVLDELNDDELAYMNINFRKFESDLRTNHQNLSVEYFIFYVKDKYFEFVNNNKKLEKIDKVKGKKVVQSEEEDEEIPDSTSKYNAQLKEYNELEQEERDKNKQFLKEAFLKKTFKKDEENTSKVPEENTSKVPVEVKQDERILKKAEIDEIINSVNPYDILTIIDRLPAKQLNSYIDKHKTLFENDTIPNTVSDLSNLIKERLNNMKTKQPPSEEKEIVTPKKVKAVKKPKEQPEEKEEKQAPVNRTKKELQEIENIKQTITNLPPQNIYLALTNILDDNEDLFEHYDELSRITHFRQLKKQMLNDLNGKPLKEPIRLSKGNGFSNKKYSFKIVKPLIKGKGIKARNLKPKKRIIKGGGKETIEPEKIKISDGRKYYDKVYIDMRRLVKNQLFCKYIKGNVMIPNLLTQTISSDCKDVIMNIINNKYNQKEYNLLTSKDKQIVKTFVKIFKYDLNIHDDEDINFSNEFNILLGEYEAGNDNEEIKKKLKRYVKMAMVKKLITNREGMELLFDLS